MNDTTAISAKKTICRKCEHRKLLAGRPVCWAREDRGLISTLVLTEDDYCPLKKHDGISVELTIGVTAAEHDKGFLQRVRDGVKGLGKAAFRIDAAPADIEADRLAICGGCDQNKVGSLGRYCGLCTCYIRAKVKIASEKCPDGKWGPVGTAARKPCGGCRKQRDQES